MFLLVRVDLRVALMERLGVNSVSKMIQSDSKMVAGVVLDFVDSFVEVELIKLVLIVLCHCKGFLLQIDGWVQAVECDEGFRLMKL